MGAVASALIGCSHNPSYKSADFSGEKLYRRHHEERPHLKELDVLGMKAGDDVTDEDIERILDETRTLKIKAGSNLLLVQSGVESPDPQMVEELAATFNVIPHTGIPSEITSDPSASISKALRLAGAQSKAEAILVYWGKLEMKRDEFPTHIVSWVPVVDFMVPDEHQAMRMSLKLALVDVRTGNWATFRTEAVESTAVTTRFAREHDQKRPLEPVKRKLYSSAAQKLRDGYTE